MERFIILVIWVIGITILKNANTKKNVGRTQNRTNQHNRKSVFGTIKEELEKEKQRLEQLRRPMQPAQPSMLSKPKEPTKPLGLEIDVIVGDEEIGEIKEDNISIGSKYNKLDLDLKRDLLKGIIYSEILSEPKGLRNMKRRI